MVPTPVKSSKLSESERADGKCAKAAWSLRGQGWQVAKKSEGTQCGGVSDHSGILAALASLLKKAGYRSATAHLSAVKCQHIGPPQKKWSDSDLSCPEGSMFPREGTSALREVELSTARCMQVAFLGGANCGCCVFNFGDQARPPSSGQEYAHICCSTVVD